MLFHMKKTIPIFGFILLISACNLFAQGRISYEELLLRSHQPRFYYETFFLPSSETGKQKLVLTFKIENAFLTFRKDMSSDHNKGDADRFKANYQVSLEVFKPDSSIKPEKERNRNENFHYFSGRETEREMRRRPKQMKMPSTEMVGHVFYQGKSSESTFEETQSNKIYAQGYLTLNLSPGKYQYVLQLTQPETENSNHSPVTDLNVPKEPDDQPFIVFVQDTSNVRVPGSLSLINFGHSAIYGKDFGVLFRLPSYKKDNQYAISIDKLTFNRKDTAKKNIYHAPVSDILQNVSITTGPDTDKVNLLLKHSEEGGTYGYMVLPNSKFPDVAYHLTINNVTSKKVVASKFYRDRWIDMPTSLLNLNVAIDMLKYILKPKELDTFRKGDYQEREKKFTSFWKKRDPTPNTDYNELMAEYYRRIDYAFEHFTTLRSPGFNSDEGKVYISMGPPKSVHRQFPTNGPSREIWNYPDKQYIFEATSGFGDYKLIKVETKKQ